MECDGCGQKLLLGRADIEDSVFIYMLCPNYTSAFFEYIQMDSRTLDSEPLGTYPCERMYEMPMYYQVIITD